MINNKVARIHFSKQYFSSLIGLRAIPSPMSRVQVATYAKLDDSTLFSKQKKIKKLLFFLYQMKQIS
jgi:hypothetical protein